MKNTTRTVLSLASIFLLGYATAHWHAPAPRAQGVKPAYVIVSAEFLERDKLGPYNEAAQPLAQQAGIQVIAAGATGSGVHVLEGEWPYTGFVAIEEFESMEALMSFWHSKAYQEAIPLRKGKVVLDFVIAVPGVEPAPVGG